MLYFVGVINKDKNLYYIYYIVGNYIYYIVGVIENISIVCSKLKLQNIYMYF